MKAPACCVTIFSELNPSLEISDDVSVTISIHSSSSGSNKSFGLTSVFDDELQGGQGEFEENHLNERTDEHTLGHSDEDQENEGEGSTYQDIVNLTEEQRVAYVLDVSTQVLENGIASLSTSSPISTENEADQLSRRPERSTRNPDAVYNFTRSYEKKH